MIKLIIILKAGLFSNFNFKVILIKCLLGCFVFWTFRLCIIYYFGFDYILYCFDLPFISSTLVVINYELIRNINNWISKFITNDSLDPKAKPFDTKDFRSINWYHLLRDFAKRSLFTLFIFWSIRWGIIDYFFIFYYILEIFSISNFISSIVSSLKEWENLFRLINYINNKSCQAHSTLPMGGDNTSSRPVFKGGVIKGSYNTSDIGGTSNNSQSSSQGGKSPVQSIGDKINQSSQSGNNALNEKPAWVQPPQRIFPFHIQKMEGGTIKLSDMDIENYDTWYRAYYREQFRLNCDEVLKHHPDYMHMNRHNKAGLKAVWTHTEMKSIDLKIRNGDHIRAESVLEKTIARNWSKEIAYYQAQSQLNVKVSETITSKIEATASLKHNRSESPEVGEAIASKKSKSSSSPTNSSSATSSSNKK